MVGAFKPAFTERDQKQTMKISEESRQTGFIASAGIFEQSMGARDRIGIGLSYRLARLHSLAELLPWNRFMGSLKVNSDSPYVSP
jgi:hypothetical protein